MAAGSGWAEETRSTWRLSLDECVRTALRRNLELAVRALDSEIARAAFLEAAARDPVLDVATSLADEHKPTSSVLEGGEGKTEVSEKTRVWAVGLNKPLPAGGTLGVRWNNNRFDTDSEHQEINPVYRSSVWLEWKQPLLKRFGLAANRARENLALSEQERYAYLYRDYQWEVAELATHYYWDLVRSRAELEAGRLALTQAQRLLEMTEADVEEGRSSRTDVLRTQAEVAARDDRVIGDEEAVRDYEDRLKIAMNLVGDPARWRSAVVPTTAMAGGASEVDETSILEEALAGSMEHEALAAALRAAKTRTQLARNELLPSLDLTGRLGSLGVGADYAGDLDELTGGDYGAWEVGVQFSVPLGRHAEAQVLERRRAEERRLEVQMHILEQDLTARARSLCRRLRSAARRIEAADRARAYRRRNLDAVAERFKLGMATHKDILDAQQDNAEAEGEYVGRLAEYNKVLTSLQRLRGAALPGAPPAAADRDAGSGGAN